MVVLTFRARPLRQPLALVVPTRRNPLRMLLDGFVRLLDWLSPYEPVPDWLREDAGLPLHEPPLGLRRRPYHPLDPSILSRWRQ